MPILKTVLLVEDMRLEMNEHRCKYGFAYTVCSWKCFSLGFHIDFRNRYIDLHIWNWFIHIGDGKCSDIPDEIMEKVYALQDEGNELMKDYHALLI